jgi:hypothetical protein
MNPTAPIETVLLFVAEPMGEARLQLGRECRLVRETRERASLRDRWAVREIASTRVSDLRNELHARPLVVHFSGHGSGEGGLVLEDEAGNRRLVATDALGRLFSLHRETVACVVLNACFSQVQAEAIAEHIQYVIGMKQEIGNEAAMHFSAGFYAALFAGEELERAFEFGVAAIHLEGGPDEIRRVLSTGGTPTATPVAEHEKPVLLGRRGPVPRLPRSGPVRPGPDRDAIVQFNVQFLERQERLGRLRAYKNLHDILHEIHSYRTQIIKAVAGVGRSPAADDPDPQSVADTLDGWLIQARESVTGARFLKRPRWFKLFETAVVFVTSGLGGRAEAAEVAGATEVLVVELGADPPVLARVAEKLCNLPAEIQVTLNEDLIENAVELNAAELLGLLDRLLAQLGGGTELLRGHVSRFRSLCESLTALIQDHDRCQDADVAVKGIVRTSGQAAVLRRQWANVSALVEAVSAPRPDNAYASRAARLYGGRALESARECARVADDPRQPQPLARFRERFDKLFHEMDKELLEVIKDLVAAAEVLDAALRGYLR